MINLTVYTAVTCTYGSRKPTIALVIAATYKLSMRGGDLVGAYLITLANPDFPVHIKTPQGYTTPFGTCFQAIGNLYGFPPAGQNFSKEFDKCVRECGYE